MEGTGRVAPAPGWVRSCLPCFSGPLAAPSLPQALGLPAPRHASRLGCTVPREVAKETSASSPPRPSARAPGPFVLALVARALPLGWNRRGSGMKIIA